MINLIKISFLFFIILNFSELCNSCDVLIWEPKDKFKKLTLREFGHAALQTQTYHMSLWPDTPKKNGKFSEINEEVNGSLNFHHDYDCYLIENHPIVISLDFVSSSKINSAYEEVLEYNDITPDNVTLTNGEKIWSHKEKCSAKEESCPTKQKHYPEVSLSGSKWCLSSDFYQEGFYKHPQSCTGFSLGLLNLASEGGVDKFIRNKDYALALASAPGGTHDEVEGGQMLSALLLSRGCGWLDMGSFKSIIYDIKENYSRSRNNGSQNNGCTLF